MSWKGRWGSHPKGRVGEPGDLTQRTAWGGPGGGGCLDGRLWSCSILARSPGHLQLRRECLPLANPHGAPPCVCIELPVTVCAIPTPLGCESL